MSTERTLVARLYDKYVDAESRVSAAAESVVGSDYFAKLFAMSVSNGMALAGLANRSLDRGVHASRIAGRADVACIGQQLARTEDKLEAVLQLVEAQQGLLAAMQARLDDTVNRPAVMHTASAQYAAQATSSRSTKAAGRVPSMGTRPANAPSRSPASGRRRTP
jgi:hypothetical protein